MLSLPLSDHKVNNFNMTALIYYADYNGLTHVYMLRFCVENPIMT